MKVTIKQAIEIIKSGGVVAMPTETVYGLAADAANLRAIQKTFKIKGRPQDNPLIVHLSSVDQLKMLAKDIPEDAFKLAEHFWPGPLTIVLKKKETVLDAVTAGLDTVAVRVPDHPIALELISQSGPLTAPSANLSGKPSPTKPEHITEDYGNKIPFLDGGSTKIGIESTVLDLSLKPYSILRPGSVSKEEISEVLTTDISIASDTDSSKKSPGTRYSHYKPKATVKWLENNDVIIQDNNNFYILHSDKFLPVDSANILHFQGDFNHLASVLYDLFRTADHSGYKTIWIEPISEVKNYSITEALINRISKAI